MIKDKVLLDNVTATELRRNFETNQPDSFLISASQVISSSETVLNPNTIMQLNKAILKKRPQHSYLEGLN